MAFASLPNHCNLDHDLSRFAHPILSKANRGLPSTFFSSPGKSRCCAGRGLGEEWDDSLSRRHGPARPGRWQMPPSRHRRFVGASSGPPGNLAVAPLIGEVLRPGSREVPAMFGCKHSEGLLRAALFRGEMPFTGQRTGTGKTEHPTSNIQARAARRTLNLELRTLNVSLVRRGS